MTHRPIKFVLLASVILICIARSGQSLETERTQIPTNGERMSAKEAHELGRRLAPKIEKLEVFPAPAEITPDQSAGVRGRNEQIALLMPTKDAAATLASGEDGKVVGYLILAGLVPSEAKETALIPRIPLGEETTGPEGFVFQILVRRQGTLVPRLEFWGGKDVPTAACDLVPSRSPDGESVHVELERGLVELYWYDRLAGFLPVDENRP